MAESKNESILADHQIDGVGMNARGNIGVCSCGRRIQADPSPEGQPNVEAGIRIRAAMARHQVEEMARG